MEKICENKVNLKYKQIFNATPEYYLIITPDIPNFTIVDVTDVYLEKIKIQRKNIIGRSIYELLLNKPDNITQISKSFERALDNKIADEMGIIKHYIQDQKEVMI